MSRTAVLGLPRMGADRELKFALESYWREESGSDALLETATTGRAVYWSRSRRRLWRKGEESGHFQRVLETRLDCDGDTLLVLVDQTGPACHTGATSCFTDRVLLASAEVLSQLDPKDVEIIKAAAKDTQEYEIAEWAKKEASSEQIVRDAGAIVVELTAEARAKFEEAMTPLYEEFGSEWMDLIEQIKKVGEDF